MQWFYARDILACLDLDPNRTLVAVADLCAAPDLPAAREERRIKAHPVLRQGARRLAAEPHDGGAPARLCLRIELAPLWLTTLNPEEVPDPALRDRLALKQRQAASLLWQAFRPQGFDSGDGLIAPRAQQGHAEQAYVGAMAIANQQVLIERQLDTAPADDEGPGADPWAARGAAVDDPQAARVAQTVRRVRSPRVRALAAPSTGAPSAGGTATSAFRPTGACPPGGSTRPWSGSSAGTAPPACKNRDTLPTPGHRGRRGG